MKTFIKELIPEFVISFYHLTLAVLACFWYRFPSRKLKVIGVTGTDGKSSVVELTAQVLGYRGTDTERKSKFQIPDSRFQNKVGSVSSVWFRIGDKAWPNKLKMTMPGRFKLQELLRKMVKAGCRYAVLEVSSEGIKQYRHWGINFDLAVFTNLTPEHIESHGSFEKYREAKGKLFKQAKVHVINLDDENAEYFLKFKAEEKWGYRINPKSEIRNPKQIPNSKFQIPNIVEATDVELDSRGIKFRVKDTQFNLSLLARFNIYNVLAVICLGLSFGIELETMKIALEKAKGIPGRMELINQGQAFTIIVDYAHTPAALEKVYQTMKSLKFKVQGSRLICVLGAAGGGRDKWKRPALGKIAAKYCQYIILTAEDPYDEKPMKIINDIAEGIKKFQIPDSRFQIPKYEKIPDRREAIKKALELARSNDTVVITGKGCEPWMMVGNKKIPWDDREVVRETLKQLNI